MVRYDALGIRFVRARRIHPKIPEEKIFLVIPHPFTYGNDHMPFCFNFKQFLRFSPAQIGEFHPSPRQEDNHAKTKCIHCWNQTRKTFALCEQSFLQWTGMDKDQAVASRRSTRRNLILRQFYHRVSLGHCKGF